MQLSPLEENSRVRRSQPTTTSEFSEKVANVPVYTFDYFLGALVPYRERDCILLSTPVASYFPRTTV